jgi:alpha-tubulin suppressor-like RCC1 family protein
MAWGRRFVAFDLGEFHVCALTQEGDAYCWGSNWYGQVGIGDPGGQGGSLDILVPTAVAGGHKFRAVATGSDTTCALAQDGATWCWGIDTGTTPASHPEPTLVPGAPAFSSIHAGFRHMCGLTQAGEAWCWGYGNPSGSSTTPVRVATSVPFASLADRPYCGLDTAGKAWCWGNNDYHQLGY